MKEIDTEEIRQLAMKTDAEDAKMEYHPSIKALVKILARKAAEEQYDALLRVMENSDHDVE